MGTSSAKSVIGIVVALVICCCVISCSSQIPLAKPYPYSTQYKMQAARHWDSLSGDVVSRMTSAECSPASAPVYVVSAAGADATPFEKAYGEILKSQLVNAGIPVTVHDTGGPRMTYSSQVVRHNPGRFVRAGRGIIHIPVSLGVYLAKNTGETLEHWWPWAIGGAVAAEALLGHAGVHATDFELIVHTSLIDEGVYKMRHTDVFYINQPRWNGDYEPNYRLSGSVVEVTQ